MFVWFHLNIAAVGLITNSTLDMKNEENGISSWIGAVSLYDTQDQILKLVVMKIGSHDICCLLESAVCEDGIAFHEKFPCSNIYLVNCRFFRYDCSGMWKLI
jgi:hypothetical protein